MAKEDLRNCTLFAQSRSAKCAYRGSGYTDGKFFYITNDRTGKDAVCGIVLPATGIVLAKKNMSRTQAADYAESAEFQKIVEEYRASREFGRDQKMFKRNLRKIHRKMADAEFAYVSGI